MKYKYSKLKHLFIEEITAGKYRAGEKLPPEPELITNYQVSRNTLRQAMQELEKAGMVYRIQGSGTYIAKRPENNGKVMLIISDLSLAVHPVTGLFIKSIGEELSGNGYLLDILANERNIERENLNRLMESYQGALIMAYDFPVSALKIFESKGFPFLFVKNYQQGYADRAEAVDYHAVGVIATNHMVRDCGRRDIAVIYMGGELSASRDFLDGVKEVCLHEGVRLGREHIYTSLPDKLPKVDGIITYDEIGLEVLMRCNQSGVKVPDTISVVGHNNLEACRYVTPSLTSVDLDIACIGTRAALRIISAIDKAKVTLGDKSQPKLVVRASSCKGTNHV